MKQNIEHLKKEKLAIQKKTPNFIRTAGVKKKRLQRSGWRRPKGITNKMRLHHKGHPNTVKAGYGTPSILRGIGKDGKSTIVVSSVSDLKNVEKTQKAIISSTVGLKKRILIIEEAKKQKIEIANLTEEAINKKMAEITARKQEQSAKKEERSKKKEAAEKKKEKETKKEEKVEVNDEEKKKEEKKEKDKVIIHKN